MTDSKTPAKKPAAKKPATAAKPVAAKASPAKKAVKAPKAAKAVENYTAQTFEGVYIFAVGKRKTAVARLRLFKGEGAYQINGKHISEYFKTDTQRRSAVVPFEVCGLAQSTYNVDVTVSGAGLPSQSDACLHALSRALEKETPEHRTALKAAGFLTRDARIKERKKPGLKRARRAPQWAKR